MKDLNALNLQGAMESIQRPIAENALLRSEAIQAKSRQEAKDRANNYRQTEVLEELLEHSRNAVEQRNAIIRFMVEELIKSEQPKESKLKTLVGYSVQFATLAGGANDVMQIIDGAIKRIN